MKSSREVVWCWNLPNSIGYHQEDFLKENIQTLIAYKISFAGSTVRTCSKIEEGMTSFV